ncbi:hypothetical protein KP509_08G007600 [Ceratopteris richardii]|uniref:TIR domain-containing protein n=1 Tax=Ceratopteris richardii TaxID=49495 RepID=A0A8T2UAM9_CERRI|nr:hypothetical protein KP509_08G007600 [Ceratopteris richardii]
MSQEYDVFICYRGLDTKRSFVSVLSGMLMSKGITCFVDYQVSYGADVRTSILAAIQSSKVYIIILSPNFASSKWCLEELVQIMSSVTGISKPPRKVIPVCYNVEYSVVLEQGEYTSFDLSKVKRSSDDERNRWSKALKDVGHFSGMYYDSKTTFLWETLEVIVAKVQAFLNPHTFIVDQGRRMPISWECAHYDVFICHWREDTQHNVVSVLRGMLLSKGITLFVAGYRQNDGNFASSKRCLDEVVHIMNRQGSPGTYTSPKQTVIPIFFDVEPLTVRRGALYGLDKVEETTYQERERWARALRDLSYMRGFEYNSTTTFQWDALYDIAKEVEASAKEVRPYTDGSTSGILYTNIINQVFQELERQEKPEDFFLVGVYGGTKSEFANSLVGTLRRRFDRVYRPSNVTEKDYKQDRVSNIVLNMCSDLIELSDDVIGCQEILRKQRCLVVLDDLGTDINDIKKLLEEMKSIFRNRSLVVLIGQSHQILHELNVHKFINLLTLEDKGDFLNICYTHKDGVSEVFLNQLTETFDMLGLDVRLLNEEEIISNGAYLEDAKVIVCIISKSFSISDFKKLSTNAVIPSNVVYVSYGSYPTDEIIPKPFFKMEVDFDRAEFSRIEFKVMVNKVLRTINQRLEGIIRSIDFPVGLAQRSTDIGCSILDCVSRSEKSLQCFGLVGMGGVGKSTLAVSIFNKIQRKFEMSCFIFNIRAKVQDEGVWGLIAVQKEILASLLKQTDNVKINNVLHGERLLSSKLKNISALIVLDDLDDTAHLNTLYKPLRSSLGPKSVVIITTRNVGILRLAQPTESFDIESLDKSMSKWLFYWHAFLRPMPPAYLEEVSQTVIEACNGLPLSLKVIASHLYCETDISCWEEISNYRLFSDIFNKLRISFDSLDGNQKDAFLDVCCFLINEDEGFACTVLEAIYNKGRTYLDILKDRCLISIIADDNDERVGRIQMHDQHRAMGKRIIRQERRDRAWDEETANDILQDEMACSSLRGLLVWTHIPISVKASDCKSLSQLRILLVEDDNRHGVTEGESLGPVKFFNDVHCGQLRWLRWEKAPFQQLPHGLCSINIRVLELPFSEIIELPTALLPNLQHLDVKYCQNLIGLGSSIGRLTDLKYLNLMKCTSMNSFPKDMESLLSLELLNLNACSRLTTLSFLPTSLRTLSLEMDEKEPGSLESVKDAWLPNLRELSITYCPRLTRFAFDSTSLERLDFTGCSGLVEFNSKGLWSLEHLNLKGCSCLTTLSFIPTNLRRLTLEMDEKDPGSLESVKDTSLPNLEELSITHCPKLRRFALAWTSLQRLDLTGCSGLVEFECKGLSSLEHLSLNGCSSVTTVSVLPTTLRILSLEMYKQQPGRLEIVEDSSQTNLEELFIKYCPKLMRLRLESTSLQRLDLSGCSGLKELHCKGFLSLKHLNLSACSCLDTLSFLPTTLRTLTLEMDENEPGSLKHVEDASLPNLEDLSIKYCPKMTSLALESTSLNRLDLTGCRGLMDLDCNGFSSLKYLNLSGCSCLYTLSCLPTTLRTLTLEMNENEPGNLKHVEHASLPSLEDLSITYCPKLTHFALKSTSLNRLDLTGCRGLMNLDCNGFSSLKHLNLSGCSCLYTLSCLPTTLRTLTLEIDEIESGSLKYVEDASLPNLEDLSITYCLNLTRFALQSTSLKRLDLTGCRRLMHLDCNGFSSLKHLNLSGCSWLHTLPFLPTTLRTLTLEMDENEPGNLEIVEYASLPNLDDISITYCPKFTRLALESTSLNRLDLTGCRGLMDLDCNGFLSLKHLKLSSCSCLDTLSFLPTTLRTLTLEMDENEPGSLKHVEDASLPNLEDLSIKYCPKMTSLALESTSLNRLDLTGCRGLMDLDCNGFSSLKHLNLSGCSWLHTLPFLPTTLRTLTLEMDENEPGNLQIVEYASLPNLEDISITYCPKFTRLALESTSLNRLDLTGCRGLMDLDCNGSLETKGFLPLTISGKSL